ncbi:hypothetical protein [Opitutus sp. ER46]|uniref:hypothetical protein n=1 Tax=Opitutus sp. ER46 TaxID=2161864 RepID=UPI0011B20A04|nr:hypothetical protein [Opitutus sp. ER46]
MSCCPWMPAWSAVAQVLGLLLLAGVEASAADRVPVQQARDASSLTEAKQQLDTLKAGNTAATVTPTDATLPGVTVPELHAPNLVDPPAPVSPRPADKPVDSRMRPGRTGNWLVDAMMEPDADASKTGGSERLRAQRRPRPDHRDNGVHTGTANDASADPADPETTATGADADAAHAPSPRSPETSPNPFTRYLSDWMTPQDYSLLRRTLAPSGERGDPTNVAPAQDASITQTLADLRASNDHPGALPPSATPPRSPADNPYLTLWQESELKPAGIQTPPPVTAPPPGPRLLEPPPPAPAPKPAVPDFVKPANDEKYFKPLKRF